VSGRRVALALLAVALGRCEGVDAPSGADAAMRVQGARYVSGRLPAPGDGPRVTTVDSPNNTVRPGQRAKAVSGRTGGTGRTVALALDNDQGYWILPVGSPSVYFPGELEFETLVDFADTLDPGRRALLLEAADATGRYGPLARLDLTVATALPGAALSVTLRWDTDADLNLQVTQPDGRVLSSRGLRAPNGDLVRVDAGAGPTFDLDSNARCAIDGRRAESALWGAPPPGRYVVAVEAWSLCGQSRASWSARVLLRGAVIGTVEGASFDTAVPTTGHALAVLTFDVAP